jgi:hypothetical protein
MLQRLEARLHFRGVQCELLDRVEARQGTRTAARSPGAGDRKTKERIRQTLLEVAHVSPPSDHPGLHICEVLQVNSMPSRAPAFYQALWRCVFVLLAGTRILTKELKTRHTARCGRKGSRVPCYFNAPILLSGKLIGFFVRQVPDLMDIILKEIECRRHVFSQNETPKINLLALRYGVSAKSIRECNHLNDSSSLVESGRPGRNFLYIPPHEETHYYKLRRIRFIFV